MSIIEQINKLPVGAELEHQMSVGFLFLKSDDLIALAESHERLLEAAKAVSGQVTDTPDISYGSMGLLEEAIQEAEKIC